MNYSENVNGTRLILARHFLLTHGWTPVKQWIFQKSGKTYDLSAADLNQLDRIEKEGLLRVELQS